VDEAVVAIVFTTVLLAAVEVAYRLGRRSRGAHDEARRRQIAAIRGVMLGLLSLLLGFTFSMAVERYSVRRDLVVKEANAIGTTWLRAGLLPEARRDEARRLLSDFVDVRLRTHALARDPIQLVEGLRWSAEIESKLWQHAEASASEAPTAVTATFIATLNQLIDTDVERVAAARNQIPAGVWLILTAVAVISCWTSAYAAGYDGVRTTFTSVLLPLTVTLVLLLILDLTHERRGIIGISQQPLVDLQTLFRSGPHARRHQRADAVQGDLARL
jgi:hypothetical protein